MNAKDAPISPENRMIARYVANAFGGAPRVDEYADRLEEVSVGILFCPDRPRAGLTAYSTVKLSDYPMPWDGGEYPTRLELAGVAANAAEFFPNILASAAFEIIRSGALVHPGSVLPGEVRRYYPDTQLPHLYLAAPFIWQDELRTLDCGAKQVSWLLAVPISEGEYNYGQAHGDQALEHLLEDRQVDIADLDRPLAR